MTFLDQFDTVLLDMNGTFMFGHDRLGPEQDYHRTYQSAGGQVLDPSTLSAIMTSTCEGLLAAYGDPRRFDDFPPLREAFQLFGDAPEAELEALELTFSRHELGTIPLDHLRYLQDLSGTHELGVVSNICAPPAVCAAHFEAEGLGNVFAHTTFSSEGRSIKPSEQIFRHALAKCRPRARVLFVGDSMKRDIQPAQRLGLRTAWIRSPGQSSTEPDVVLDRLPDLGTVFRQGERPPIVGRR